MRPSARFILATTLFAMSSAAAAPADALAGLSFLVGNWTSGDGQVSETGGTSKGTSTITPEASGAALLRRDHTDLFDKSGKPAGSFDQVMMIYADGPAIHAEYLDGEHVIHYVSAEIVPGKSVTFSSAPGAGPVFRLSYALQAPDALGVVFGMVAPGQAGFQQIAAGTLHRR